MPLILIVEDDKNLSKGLTVLFESEGFSCICAYDGPSAYIQFENNPPDFCVIDVMLPGMQGTELVRKIRASDTTTPILILSAKSSESERILGFSVGADDYVTKPFSAPELVARVKVILKRTRGESFEESFIFGDLVVDPASQRAKRGIESIELKAREVAIMQILANHPGRVVTRDMLMDFAWGRAYLPSSRALDQYVSELRKKIESDPSKPALILTVWGKGYRHDPFTT